MSKSSAHQSKRTRLVFFLCCCDCCCLHGGFSDDFECFNDRNVAQSLCNRQRCLTILRLFGDQKIGKKKGEFPLTNFSPFRSAQKDAKQPELGMLQAQRRSLYMIMKLVKNWLNISLQNKQKNWERLEIPYCFYPALT